MRFLAFLTLVPALAVANAEPPITAECDIVSKLNFSSAAAAKKEGQGPVKIINKGTKLEYAEVFFTAKRTIKMDPETDALPEGSRRHFGMAKPGIQLTSTLFLNLHLDTADVKDRPATRTQEARKGWTHTDTYAEVYRKKANGETMVVTSPQYFSTDKFWETGETVAPPALLSTEPRTALYNSERVLGSTITNPGVWIESDLAPEGMFVHATIKCVRK